MSENTWYFFYKHNKLKLNEIFGKKKLVDFI
jgi:hypothetical protein